MRILDRFLNCFLKSLFRVYHIAKSHRVHWLPPPPWTHHFDHKYFIKWSKLFPFLRSLFIKISKLWMIWTVARMSYKLKHFSRKRSHSVSVYTLPPKSLHTFSPVTKTTLNTGGVGEAGANPQTRKMGSFFSVLGAR